MENNSLYPRGIEVTVCHVIINKDNKVAVFKSPKWDKYQFSGGHIEPGETIVEAGLREAQEEIGADLTIIDTLHVGEWFVEPPQFKRSAHFIYFDLLCKLKPGQEILLDQDELTGYEWLSIEDAIKVVDDSCVTSLKKLKSRIDSGEVFF